MSEFERTHFFIVNERTVRVGRLTHLYTVSIIQRDTRSSNDTSFVIAHESTALDALANLLSITFITFVRAYCARMYVCVFVCMGVCVLHI